LQLPANRLSWPVVDDSRPGGNQGAAGTRFCAVGHRKGSKQLLNTNAGLVRTVVRNEGVVNAAVLSSGSVQNQHSFGVLWNQVLSPVEPKNSVHRTREAGAGHKVVAA
jgi:hypothetical protein